MRAACPGSRWRRGVSMRSRTRGCPGTISAPGPVATSTRRRTRSGRLAANCCASPPPQDPGHAARIAGELYGGSAREDPALARDLLHATTRLGPARGYYYQLLSSIAWTSLPRLPRLRPPTLILAGDDDPIIPLINARIMHWLIPRSELVIYHGGHLELATDAERIAPVVEAFLGPEGADDVTGG